MSTISERHEFGVKVKQVLVNSGYRGHVGEVEMDMHVDKKRKLKTPKRL